MYGYYNQLPPWFYPPTMYPPTPPVAPTGNGMSVKEYIRTMKAWEKFTKQQEEEKKKKDSKNPQGPQLKAWEVFVIMTALSPIIGEIVSKLKEFILAHL